METGVGVDSWVSSAAMWTTFAGLVGEAMAVMAAEVATVAANWQGTAPIQLTAVTGPFMGWLMQMEAVAAANALACLGVAEAFALANGTMIPVPVVNANRVSEMIAEATNFFGINSGLILFLNQQYGQYWTQNAGTMLSYDTAVQVATVPKPSSPPPPLADAGRALDAAAQAGQMAASSVTEPLLAAAQQGGQAPGTASAPAELMQSLTGSLPQLLQAPGQLLQSGGSSNPLSSLMGPFESLLGNFGGSTDSSGALAGIGPLSPAFANANSLSTAGSGAGLGGGGGMGVLGGGLGGNMLTQGAYPTSGHSLVKSQQVFSGVPTSSRPDLTVSNSPTPAMATAGGGAGMGPMMRPGAADQTSAPKRADSDLVISINPVGGTPPNPRS